MLNPPDLPTVGASGGIVGLLTAAFVLSFHPACHRSRWWLRVFALLLAGPALIPTAATPGAPSIVDVSSHLGGAAAGVVMGFVLQALWPEEAERPRFPAFAANFAAVGFGAVAAAFVLVAWNYPAYAKRESLLITDADTPKSQAEGQAARPARARLSARPTRPPLSRRMVRGAGRLRQRRAGGEDRAHRPGDHRARLLACVPDAHALRPGDAALASGALDDAKVAAQPFASAAPRGLGGRAARL